MTADLPVARNAHTTLALLPAQNAPVDIEVFRCDTGVSGIGVHGNILFVKTRIDRRILRAVGFGPGLIKIGRDTGAIGSIGGGVGGQRKLVAREREVGHAVMAVQVGPLIHSENQLLVGVVVGIENGEIFLRQRVLTR